MARIVGPLYDRWRRDHFGLEGQKGFSQSVARNSTKRQNSGTTRQQQYREKVRRIGSLWNSLSDEDKSLWDLFGAGYSITDKYGKIIHIPGYQWFSRLNLPLMATDANPITIPPDNDLPDYNPIIVLSQPSAGGPVVCSAIPVIPAGSALIVYRSLNLPKSKSKMPGTGSDFLKFLHGSPPLVSVALETELTFNTTRSFFRAYGLDAFGRAGDIRIEFFDPIS